MKKILKKCLHYKYACDILNTQTKNTRKRKGVLEYMRCVSEKDFRKAMIDTGCNTFGELEVKSEIDRTTLSNFAKGIRKPSYESISKLADTFGLTYEEIGRIFFYRELTET